MASNGIRCMHASVLCFEPSSTWPSLQQDSMEDLVSILTKVDGMKSTYMISQVLLFALST